MARKAPSVLLLMLGALLPIAAAITAADIAPPAKMSGRIVGAEVTSKVEFGEDAHSATILATTFKMKSNFRIGPLPIAARIRFTYNEPFLTDATGQLDTQRINTIVQDLSHPQVAEAQISDETRRYYEKVAAIAGEVVLITEAGVVGFLKVRRRRLDQQPVGVQAVLRADRQLPRQVGWLALILAAVLLLITPIMVLAHGRSRTTIVTDPLLGQIGVEGVAVSGPVDDLRKLIEPSIANYLQRVDTFYKAKEASFAAAFQARYGDPPPEKVAGTKRIVFADDFQGQEGPARVVGDAAKAYGADLIVIGGDTTTSGNSLETFELSSLREHAGDIPALINRGKHDPSVEDLQKMVKGFGNYQIADGKPHIIGGIDILGINAPTRLTASGITEVIDPELKGLTPVEATVVTTHKLIQKVCASAKRIVVTMHDQLIGTPLAQQGCKSVPLVLTGRQYTTQPPMQFGPTTEFVSGSSGGHTPNGGIEAYNEITSPATFQVITVDAKTQSFLSADLITLDPSPATSVTIEPLVPLDHERSLAASQALMAKLATSD